MRKRSFLMATLLAAALAACSPDKPAFRGVDITGADYAKDFALNDQDGRARSVKDFAGKVVVVFFGYTQCPDVCPTTLQELVEVKRALGSDGDKLQAVFITVDPERDTQELLKAYMANFDPSFVALRPSLEQLQPLLKDFKIYAKRSRARRPRATPWTTRRKVMCTTHKAVCACTTAMAVGHRH